MATAIGSATFWATHSKSVYCFESATISSALSGSAFVVPGAASMAISNLVAAAAASVP